MLTIKDAGNTTIRVATTGVEIGGGTKWTAYPDPDPSVRLGDKQQEQLKELSITGIREKEDLTGNKMQESMATAIAELAQRLDGNSEIGLTVNSIAIDPKSNLAAILERAHGIKPLEAEMHSSAESKG